MHQTAEKRSATGKDAFAAAAGERSRKDVKDPGARCDRKQESSSEKNSKAVQAGHEGFPPEA